MNNTQASEVSQSATTTTETPGSTTMTLEEAAKVLKEKLGNLKEVFAVTFASTDESILVYTTTAKVWVDLPPVFPKGPDGYTVHMIVSRPTRTVEPIRPTTRK